MNTLQKIYRRIFFRSPVNAVPKVCNKKNNFELLASAVQLYAIVLLDEDGYVTTWSNAAQQMNGYTTAEIIGCPYAIFYGQQDVYSGDPAHHLRLAKLYGHLEVNACRLKKDGSSFWANIVFTALKDDAGNVFGYATITRDTTEIKKTQEQLELFSRQINQSNDSIYTVDADQKLTSWNHGAEKLYGYTKEEALGQTPNDLLQTVITKHDLTAGLQAISHPGYWTGELRRRTKAGDYIYVRSSTSSINDESGRLTGMIGVSFNISKQKELEEQVQHLASMVEQSTDGISSVDLDSTIISWNGGSETIFGYTREEAIGKTGTILGFIDIPKEEADIFLRMVIEKGSVKEERRFIRKDGSVFFGSTTANIIRNKRGEITSVVFVVKDISNYKQLENQLKKSNEELEQKVKERTEEIYKTERHFRALVENSQDIISLIDKNLKPVYLSPASEKVTGWTLEERNRKESAELLHPDDLDGLAVLIKNVLDNPGKIFDMVVRTKHKAGHYIWLEGVITNLLHDPVVAGIVSNVRDITERKQAEDAIRKSEILYRSLFENILHGFAYCKGIFEDGRLVDYIYLNVNKEYELLSGLTNVTGKRITELVPGLFVNQPYYANFIGRVALEGIPEKIETYVEPLDLWLNMSLYSPEKEYFVALVDNISERKKAEEAIRKSEILYRSLFENMLHGFAYCKIIIESGQHVDFTYVAVNQEYEKITGISHATGKKLSELAPGLLDSDPEYAAIIKRVIISGVPAKFETYAAPLNKWFAIGIYSPEPGYFVTLADNITERKNAEEAIQKSEALYRNLFKNMLHGFAYCKGIYEDGQLIDFTYITVNSEYELMHENYGMNGKNVSEVIPGLLSSDASYCAILTRVSLLGTLEKFETFVKPLEKWLSISLYSPAKEYFVILADDISERKLHEQKIIQLNEELEERVARRTEQLRKTNVELEAFSYSVSHDLRAPLRGITSFTTILEEEYVQQLNDEAKRITAVIKNNALRMARLIDDLLSFSRMSRQDIIKTMFDTNAIVHEIINETALQQNNNRQITWRIHPMPQVRADLNTIRQVWINLISNAIKYTGKCDSPAIEIGSYPQQKEIVFYIKDNGAGFDEKYKNKLFGVFQRLHSHDEFEGTGIGLAIVEKIISKHKGRVWAEAAVDKGACFYFSLPADTK